MSISVSANFIPGELGTRISRGPIHDARTWGQLAARRIVGVAESAPQPIRDQAQDFQERVGTLVAHYVDQVRTEMRSALAAEMDREGMRQAAELVRRWNPPTT